MAQISLSGGSVLGIDIGSVSVSIAQLDAEGNILRTFCQFHKGNIRDTFSDAAKNNYLGGSGVRSESPIIS
jgi:activator of 2-hydroxyglutaryl-CoA dehydratase